MLCIHHVPGRLRLQTSQLKGNRLVAEAACDDVIAIPGVLKARVSCTGHCLQPPRADTSRAVAISMSARARLGTAADFAGCRNPHRARPARQRRRHKLGRANRRHHSQGPSRTVSRQAGGRAHLTLERRRGAWPLRWRCRAALRRQRKQTDRGNRAAPDP